MVATNGVDLDVRAGEIHAIIGPNGAGKSTLIAQICGEIRPDSGSIHLDGRDVTALRAFERARLAWAARSRSPNCARNTRRWRT